MFRRSAGLVVLSLTVVLCSLAITSAQPPNEPAPAVENMHPAHRALYFSVRRGTEWLMQAQQPNGLFHQGLNVAINTPLETAHFYHQAEAAIALAKVSRLTMNARYHTAAQQATLTLLSSTKVDPQNGRCVTRSSRKQQSIGWRVPAFCSGQCMSCPCLLRYV